MRRLGFTLLLGVVIIAFYGAYSGFSWPLNSSDAVVERGIASWYGREEQGKLTASGEVFNRHNYTAASRHLPFNAVVRVTNEANGRSVRVRINDRGPYVRGRVLDLSEAAADDLDMKRSGTARVKIQVLDAGDAHASLAP